MSVYRLWICFVEIYKTINKLNPEFMNNICKVKENKRFSQRTIQIKFLNSWPEPGYFRGKKFQSTWTKDLELPSSSYQVMKKSYCVLKFNEKLKRKLV